MTLFDESVAHLETFSISDGAAGLRHRVNWAGTKHLSPQESPDPQVVHRAADLIARETVAAARPRRALHAR